MITARAIQSAIAEEFSVTHSQLIGARRTRGVVTPRHVAMYLIREICRDMSFPQIGAAFGCRDHTTIMAGAKRGRILLEENPEMRTYAMRALNRLERAGVAENARGKRHRAAIAGLERFMDVTTERNPL